MAKIIRMPVLGIAIANISINEWFIKEGEEVSQGQPLLEVQTDKITMEVPSEESGVLLKIFFDKDVQLTDGVPIAIIGESGENFDHLVTEVQAELQGVEQPQPQATPSPEAVPEITPEKPAGKILATPLVKRIAREKGIDLSKVMPSGPGGRITKEDVLAFAELKPTPQVAQQDIAPGIDSEEIEIIPLTGTRKIIADNMVRSVQTAPHYTVTAFADCMDLVALRDNLKQEYKDAHEVDLTYLSFVIKAIAMAVKEVPIVNSTVRGDQIIVQKVANVGMAVAYEDLLYVPVIKRPIEKTLLQIAREAADLAKLVREDKLELIHITGSTITLTNVGVVDTGTDGGTAVINPPEVAVVGMGRVRDHVVPFDGEIAIRPCMNLWFSYDHRVVMGVPGTKFAERVKYYLEHPDLLLTT